MSEPIIIPPLLIGRTLSEQITGHNARVERVWLTVGSRCKPFDSKRAADRTATLSELQRPQGEVEVPVGLWSDGSSATCLMKDYLGSGHP
jgi:hypothetical protein